MVLILDNYDGCANSLYQLAGQIDPDVRIVRNDKVTIRDIEEMGPSHLLISGGSVPPERAGIDPEVVRRFAGRIPILGVCLGYRVICAAYGAASEQMQQICQGKRLEVLLDTDCPLFAGLPARIQAGFYHSATVPEQSLPPSLGVIARKEGAEGEPAGVADAAKRMYGIAFHPESFLSEYGLEIMRNFLRF